MLQTRNSDGLPSRPQPRRDRKFGSHNQRRRNYVNKVGILATLQARPGKEADVEQFLLSAGALVEAETGTTAWFAFKVAPATFGIFDTFKDEDGRSAHVNGEIAKGALRSRRRTVCRSPRYQARRHPCREALASRSVSQLHRCRLESLLSAER